MITIVIIIPVAVARVLVQDRATEVIRAPHVIVRALEREGEIGHLTIDANVKIREIEEAAVMTEK